MATGIKIPEVEAWLADAEFDRPFNVGISQERWKAFVADAQRFVADGWLRKAAGLGWLDVELFGVDALKPLDNLDEGRTGLVPALRGRSVVGLTLDYAVLRNLIGDDCTMQSRWLQLTARHKRMKPLVLVWDLCPTRTPRTLLEA